jgi:hypothetical protein
MFGNACDNITTSFWLLCFSSFQEDNFEFGYHFRRAIYVPWITNVIKITSNPLSVLRYIKNILVILRTY